MNAPAFARVREIFDQLAGLGEPERAARLEALCGSDREVRREVESLLASADSARGFLDTPAAGIPQVQALLGADEPDALIGRVIGDYRIDALLGEGGMGVVYRAEQQRTRRTVALKLIRSPFLTGQMLRRFEHEARILGRLKHPGIAQIFEAGSVPDERGRAQPFFAMEFVSGAPLLPLVRRKGLDLRTRLELFALVCDAVEHAHQKGIVHRDLKPANILVEEAAAEGGNARAPTSGGEPGGAVIQSVGRPKVLDFGVARIIDSDVAATTMQTESGAVIGTLQYMSPEQVGGAANEADTRSDIYALGVILFELLAGRPPYQVAGATLAHAARMIAEIGPPRAGSIEATLRGDIETIIAKALEKEPARRYQSAAEFSADIRRWLADEPILARPPSAAYHARKLIVRHKLASGALALLIVSSIAYGVAMGFLYRQAVRDRQAAREAELRVKEALARAQSEADDMKAVNFFLMNMFDAARPGSRAVKDDRVDSLLSYAALTVHEYAAKRPAVEAALLQSLGNAFKERGQFDRAIEMLKRAAGIIRSLHGEDAPALANALKEVAEAHMAHGDMKSATPYYRDAFRIQRGQFQHNPSHLAMLLQGLAHAESSAGEWTAAESHWRECIGLCGQIPGGADLESHALNNLAGMYADQERYADSESALRRAMTLAQGRSKGTVDEDFDSIRCNLAWVLMMEGRAAEAEPLARGAYESKRAMYKNDHPKVAVGQVTFGQVLQALGRLDEAQTHLRQAVAMHERVTAPKSDTLFDARVALAECLAARGSAEEARALLVSARAARGDSPPPTPAGLRACQRVLAALGGEATGPSSSTSGAASDAPR